MSDRVGAGAQRGGLTAPAGARGGREATAARERRYAPRSGGRTAAQQSTTGAEGRRYPVQGTAALQVAAAEPLRTQDTAATPRLRVAPPAPISAPRAPFIAVVIALVVAGVFGILLINTKTNENTFRLSKLQDRQSALDNQQQDLENRIAGYESTGNLDAAARRLGLVKADTPAYIRLPDGKVIGVPRPGEGRQAVTAQDPSAAATGAAAVPDGDAQNGVTATETNGGTAPNGATGANGGTAPNGTTGTNGGAAQNATDQSAG